MGPALITSIRSGVFDTTIWQAALADASRLTFDEALAAIGKQTRQYAALIAEFSDDDLRSEVQMFYRTGSRGSIIVNIVFCRHTAYRTRCSCTSKRVAVTSWGPQISGQAWTRPFRADAATPSRWQQWSRPKTAVSTRGARIVAPALAKAMPLPVETCVGPYKLLAPIGIGGMGEVYRARDSRIGREVEMEFPADSFVGRFNLEMRVVAALNRPNICAFYNVGPNYLVTELVEGETLRGWLMRRPSLEQLLAVARQILEGLAAAHGAGFVHRDLKPQNIMVRTDGYVKVLDFGLAKRIAQSPFPGDSDPTAEVTLRGHILGTTAYMSAEQIQGHDVDERSDLFAFGIVL